MFIGIIDRGEKMYVGCREQVCPKEWTESNKKGVN